MTNALESAISAGVGSRQRDPIAALNGCFQVSLGVWGDAAGEIAGVDPDLRVVEQMQGLRRDGGRWPFGHAAERFGGVEDHHHGDQFRPLYSEIDAPAFAALVEGAGPVELRVQGAADGKQGVANDLGFKPAGGFPPKKLVVAIQFGLGIIWL